MKFVIVNAVLMNGKTFKARVNPTLVEEIDPARYVNEAGEDQDGAALIFQTGRSQTIIESPEAIATALSRGFDQ